jgi:hypothetical protein
MSMFDDYNFEVEAKLGSGIVSSSEGKVSATRIFIVLSKHAEELGLRLLGKWASNVYVSPVLPAAYPSSYFTMVAKSFSIEQISACCFNVNVEEGGPFITDLESRSEMERYWGEDTEENKKCFAVVTVAYSEPEWDCTGNGIQEETGISVEINPAYEMFTLPNRNLVWADLTTEKELKADSYAYKVIPKSDVIVSWHNIPVLDLPIIFEKLKNFRGTVNESAWGALLFCLEGQGSEADGNIFEPETLMFINYEEDRSKRTTGFANSLMDTTTIKLHFKEKDILDGENHFGWNHLYLDHGKASAAPIQSAWARVKQSLGGGQYEDLFKKEDFSQILNW